LPHRFSKHYTLDQARACCRKSRRWLAAIERLHADLEKTSRRLAPLAASGQDLGGELVNRSVHQISDLRDLFLEFQGREIFIKDVERGLVDFPAFRGGKEVFPLLAEGRGRHRLLARLRFRLLRPPAAVSGYGGRQPHGLLGTERPEASRPRVEVSGAQIIHSEIGVVFLPAIQAGVVRRGPAFLEHDPEGRRSCKLCAIAPDESGSKRTLPWPS